MRILKTALGIVFGVILLVALGYLALQVKGCKEEPVEVPTERAPEKPVATPVTGDRTSSVVVPDSTGELVRRPVRDSGNEVVAVIEVDDVQPDSSGNNFLLVERVEGWFPDLRPRDVEIRTTLSGVTVYNQPRPLFELGIEPTFGLQYSGELEVSVGFTPLRAWMLYPELGVSYQTASKRVMPYAAIGVDIRDNLMFSVGVDLERKLNVGVKYHF